MNSITQSMVKLSRSHQRMGAFSLVFRIAVASAAEYAVREAQEAAAAAFDPNSARRDMFDLNSSIASHSAAALRIGTMRPV